MTEIQIIISSLGMAIVWTLIAKRIYKEKN